MSSARPLREAVIDTDAIAANTRLLREITGVPHFLAALKADGYGHGAVLAARAVLAGGADHLGVADMGEAYALREAGIEAPILAWLLDPLEDFRRAVAENISIGVSSVAQLERVASAAADAGIRALVHLKVDTGLSRNGLSAEHWESAFARAAQLHAEGAIEVRGLWSHLANASHDDDLAQCARFDVAIAALADAGLEPPMLHIAASAAAIRYPEMRYTMVRCGIAVYGVSPWGTTEGLPPLKAAMTLRSRVASVRRVPADTGVGYDYAYRTDAATTLALVPLGYADGVPRHASSSGPLLIGGEAHTVSGRVAMDQFTTDVGDDQVDVGDEVVLWGDAADGVPTADDWARAAGTIGYEIVSRVGNRVVRTPRGAAGLIGTHTVHTAAEMEALGEQLGATLGAGDLIVLTGALGAGKTTLTRGIGAGLDVRGPVTSPTFVLARTHPNLADHVPLVHVDAYRLTSALELDDLDIDFAGSAVVVEWGAGMLDGVSESWLEVAIDRPHGAGEGSRDAGEAGEVGSDANAAAAAEALTDGDSPRRVRIRPHGGWHGLVAVAGDVAAPSAAGPGAVADAGIRTE